MDETISPARNAKKYFEKYNKEKTMQKMSTQILLELEEETSYIASVKDMIDIASDETTISEIKEELVLSGYIEERKDKLKKKKLKLSEPLEFTSSDGYTILCGRNNRQNDELTFKIANKFDLWLHIRNIPGCHTVIKSQSADIPEQTLLEAALLAANFSKSSNDTKASVDYTQIKFVKKPSGAKPGMVLYDNFKTIIVEPNKDIINTLRK
jgi:predicted ribosome quality control (RQC) complex YloA/Tae2 family protein